MRKTLIIVVDRDDDFGSKADVTTPLIGLGRCSDAAVALGIKDPEDSDVNTLFAAINIYNEMASEGKDVEISLICGDVKVGYKSDDMIIDELESVLQEVRPDRVILVSDGAEDEFVYPIISSRIPIDSVRKVFVKQAPGLEGTVYIINKMMKDSEKRKRFLAPIGWIISLIGLLYFLPLFIAFLQGDANPSSMSGSMVVILVGLLFLSYAYNLTDLLKHEYILWKERVRSGNLMVTFTLMSVALCVVGLIVGAYAVLDLYSNSMIYSGLWFVSNCIWPIYFGILVYMIGEFINDYLNNNKIKRSFLIGILNVSAMFLILQSVVDLMIQYLGFDSISVTIVAFEILSGVFLAFVSRWLQHSIYNHLNSMESTAE